MRLFLCFVVVAVVVEVAKTSRFSTRRPRVNDHAHHETHKTHSHYGEAHATVRLLNRERELGYENHPTSYCSS